MDQRNPPPLRVLRPPALILPLPLPLPPPPFWLLPVAASLCVLVLLVLLVVLVRRCIRWKREAAEVEKGEDVTYSQVNISHSRKKPIKQSRESGPAAVYSEVKTKRDVCYGEIVINTNRRRAAEVEMGEDVTYSDVKTSQSRKKPIKKSRWGRESGPAAVYSEVKTKRDVCYGEIVINTNRRRAAEVEMGEDVTYSDVKTSQSRKKPIKKSRWGRESGPAAVYSEVKTKRDVCYGEIVINTNRRRAEIVPEPDVLYSSLR
ncbi:hypothetical protein CesoFtcFv8_026492 [Champsocephalus esox]|uniref:Uncharacterized protein n=1 Tax=Champsocephalus esox TaxID=159716 RepID=A0AAN8AZF7_9TELE|nr:hypothetical protein CesoFtcFv8_026492 [Champsocephalus esox]